MGDFTKPCDNSWCKGTMYWYPDPPGSQNRVHNGQWECNSCTRLCGDFVPQKPVTITTK